MDVPAIDAILNQNNNNNNSNSNKSTSKDAPQLKCTDVARVLEQAFLNEKTRKTPHLRYSHPGLPPGQQKVKYEFINMVGNSQNITSSSDSHPSLPPLYNHNNSLVRESTWYRMKTKEKSFIEEKRDSSPHGTPKLQYNLNPTQRIGGDDRGSPDRKRKDKRGNNKENRVVNQKFLEYINKRRELTRQLHVDSNPLSISERPGVTPSNPTPNLKREHSTMKEKIADFRRWREKEKTALNIVGSFNGVPDLKRESTEVHATHNGNHASGNHQTNGASNSYQLDYQRQSTMQTVKTKPVKQQEIQDVRLLRKTLKEHDQRMDSRDSARRSKASKESKETAQPPAKQTRQGSAGTWHTWRDMNESYAYSDVKKYIDENDLMSPSKDARIRRWVKDVDKHMVSSGIMDSGELPILPVADESMMSSEFVSSASSKS